MRLANRAAVLTGAANGIGAATARRFSEEGASVVVADLDEAAGTALVSEIVETGGKAVFANCDVSERADLEAAFDLCSSRFGRLDILFNNAAIQDTRGILDATDEDFDTLVRVNLRSVFIGIRESCAPDDRSRQWWLDHQYVVDFRYRWFSGVCCLSRDQGRGILSHPRCGDRFDGAWYTR